jgi:hypothetical protein
MSNNTPGAKTGQFRHKQSQLSIGGLCCVDLHFMEEHVVAKGPVRYIVAFSLERLKLTRGPNKESQETSDKMTSVLF